MTRKRCFVLSCGKKQTENKNLVFFSVPKGPEREKWIAAVKRPSGSISLFSDIHCCQDHFNMKDDVQNYKEFIEKGWKPKLKKPIIPFIAAPTNGTPRSTGAVENSGSRFEVHFIQPDLSPSASDLSLSCRVCLKKYAGTLKSLLNTYLDSEWYPDIFLKCTTIQITDKPEQPNWICEECDAELIRAYKFRRKCIQSDAVLSAVFAKSQIFKTEEIEISDYLIKEEEKTIFEKSFDGNEFKDNQSFNFEYEEESYNDDDLYENILLKGDDKLMDVSNEDQNISKQDSGITFQGSSDQQWSTNDFNSSMPNSLLNFNTNMTTLKVEVPVFQENTKPAAFRETKKVTSTSVNNAIQFPKPAYNNSRLLTLALKNSRTGSLAVYEIYSFLCEHFPYFKTAKGGWKNSIRHTLSFKGCFQKFKKTENNEHKRRHCLWVINPTKKTKLDKELQKYTMKDLIKNRKAMAYPQHLELLELGKMKHGSSAENKNSDDDTNDSDEDAMRLSSDWDVDNETLSRKGLLNFHYTIDESAMPTAKRAKQDFNY